MQRVTPAMIVRLTGLGVPGANRRPGHSGFTPRISEIPERFVNGFTFRFAEPAINVVNVAPSLRPQSG